MSTPTLYAPKIYKLENTEKEVHLVGEYVGVCWNLHTQKKMVKDEEGNAYSVEVLVRMEDEPYIDILSIRDRPDDEPYERESSPCEGGMTAIFAQQLAQELLAAVEYLKKQEAQT